MNSRSKPQLIILGGKKESRKENTIMQHHYTNKKKVPHQRNFKCKRTKTQKVQRVETISVAKTHAVKRSYNLNLEKFKESKLSRKVETRSKELLQMV